MTQDNQQTTRSNLLTQSKNMLSGSEIDRLLWSLVGVNTTQSRFILSYYFKLLEKRGG